MNPSDPVNVTPLEPVAPVVSLGTATPLATPPSRASIASGAKPVSGMRTRAIAVVALVAIVLIGYKLFHHHRNSYEATADAVTVALANNNMTPVLHKFNAIRLPELQDREKVGHISNFLVPMGAFKGSKEITPANSDAGLHEFTETFANGTAFEKFELDADGKIVKFHIGPQPSAAP